VLSLHRIVCADAFFLLFCLDGQRVDLRLVGTLVAPRVGVVTAGVKVTGDAEVAEEAR
jgi:hypothetical protein